MTWDRQTRDEIIEALRNDSNTTLATSQQFADMIESRFPVSAEPSPVESDTRCDTASGRAAITPEPSPNPLRRAMEACVDRLVHGPCPVTRTGGILSARPARP